MAHRKMSEFCFFKFSVINSRGLDSDPINPDLQTLAKNVYFIQSYETSSSKPGGFSICKVKNSSVLFFKCLIVSPFKAQCHEIDIFEGLNILFSTFCVRADGFNVFSFHYPIDL